MDLKARYVLCREVRIVISDIKKTFKILDVPIKKFIFEANIKKINKFNL